MSDLVKITVLKKLVLDDGKKSQVASCTDGFRPVVFLIEPHVAE